MALRPLLFLSMFLLACGEEDTDKPVDETGDSTPTDEGLCPDLVEPPCVDDMIMDLSLHDEVSDGSVLTTTDGDDFVTTVDAEAGGMNQASNNPWVYIRFDDEGATRVDISDEDALESAQWHMSMRRYLTRLNGGDGGPSCVGVDKMTGQDYASISELPTGVEYELEDFYPDGCGDYLQDNSGLGGPAVALDGWWSYTDCVATTLLPFLVQLEDGRVIKLVMEEYYGSGQATCNAGGGAGSDSANLKLRWRFLE